ncbi:sensor histidine kinase [Fluviicola taffensis]|uniref:Signal transduction histidine kinase, LytS n=1 Tax=Fluviicola taffensis (strain DSM 16823 / NCIMB 13979 / RW262) TaxID=755732 RepID=F2IJE8_FLUTR|nr:histidine kinase [Fluviicola taffensis]AEA42836.1 signal transduction histidine kinase, LytS [Fluviicola taffensis DSM 16823]
MKFSYFNFWLRNIVIYLFFCLLGLIMVLVDGTHQIHEKGRFMHVVFNGGVMFAIAHIQVYIHNRFLYERFFSKQNLKYFLGTVSLFASYFLINYFTPFTFVSNRDVITMCISIFLIYLVGLGFYYMHKNISDRNRRFLTGLLEKDDEIRHLKAQLNPHFLFNALNNLYATSLTAPNETPDKILELSDLLRYQIESSKKERVPLYEEIDFIKKYLSYEQNRSPKLNISLHNKIAMNQLMLSPMLFMPFIENAIKYSSGTEKPTVSLEISTDKQRLTFKVWNNFDPERREFSGTNTGISNTKQRLELMYNNKHELIITDADGIHTVELTLVL